MTAVGEVMEVAEVDQFDDVGFDEFVMGFEVAHGLSPFGELVDELGAHEWYRAFNLDEQRVREVVLRCCP